LRLDKFRAEYNIPLFYKNLKMNKILILLHFLIPICSIAQEYIEPLSFFGYQPKWNHVVFDSSRLGMEGFDGSTHLITDFNHEFILVDSFAYVRYWDYYGGPFMGCYFEKFNTNTGDQIWAQVFGKQFAGYKEFPSYWYLNKDNQIELLCFKEMHPHHLSVFTDATLSIRKYDKETGEILENTFPEDFVGNDTLNWFWQEHIILPTQNDGYVYIEFNPGHKNSISFVKKLFDNKINYLTTDTIHRNKEFYTGYYKRPWLFSDSLIINPRHSTEQRIYDPPSDDGYDQFELWIDIFDSEFNHINSIDIQSYMLYNWEFGSVVKDDYLIVSCEDSFNVPGIRTHLAKVIFDQNFNHVETIDFKNEYRFTSISKLPYDPGFLVLIDIYNDSTEMYEWRIHRTDGNGNLVHYSTLEIDDTRDFYGFHDTRITQQNILMIDYVARKNISDGVVASTHGIIGVDLEELGVVSSHDIPHKKNISELVIFPNPAGDEIEINFPNTFAGHLSLFDSQGRKAGIYNVEDADKIRIETSNLKGGIYFIIAENEKGLFKGSFIKE